MRMIWEWQFGLERLGEEGGIPNSLRAYHAVLAVKDGCGTHPPPAAVFDP
jgi:hypothetical protein